VAESFLAGKVATAANPDIYQVIVHVVPRKVQPCCGAIALRRHLGVLAVIAS
jgi:hypothetical protein